MVVGRVRLGAIAGFKEGIWLVILTIGIKTERRNAMLFDDVRTWKDYRGKKEYLKHLSGEALTLKQAVIAMCYSCTAGYFDGRVDCEASDCPLHGHMPYRKDKNTTKKKRSEKQKDAIARLTESRLESTKKMQLQEF
jgi:hypothetical protein